MNSIGLLKLRQDKSPAAPAKPAAAGDQTNPPEYRNIAARLKSFAAIQPGWYEGHGIAFNPTDLDWLTNQFAQRYPADLPRPLIAPTVEGNIELEWDDGKHVIFLEINPATRQAEWRSYQPPDQNELEKTLDLSDPAAWQWLTQAVRAKLDNPHN